jgi:hypothetical protein
MGVLVLIAGPVRAADAPGLEAKAAFARLKSLAGQWRSEAGGEGQHATVVYRITSHGSVVMETLFPGTDHEMVSMYHLDGGELRLTHYCHLGNQPRLKLDKQASKPDELRFVFEGGTNLDPKTDMHMHSGRISFRDGGRIEEEWDAYQGDKKIGSNKLVLSRP